MDESEGSLRVDAQGGDPLRRGLGRQLATPGEPSQHRGGHMLRVDAEEAAAGPRGVSLRPYPSVPRLTHAVWGTQRAIISGHARNQSLTATIGHGWRLREEPLDHGHPGRLDGMEQVPMLGLEATLRSSW